MSTPNGCLIHAILNGDLKKTMELINEYGVSHLPEWLDGYFLLFLALMSKNEAIAKQLITSGCKVDIESTPSCNTALHFAVLNNYADIVEMILYKGVRNDVKNDTGKTPLFCAVQNKNVKVTELLLKYGADVNARDVDGGSLLHLAVEKECLFIVEVLLKFRANVNFVCNAGRNNGYTPLHLCFEIQNKAIFMLLISKGADVNARYNDGKTLLHVAIERGNVDYVDYLLKSGAYVNSVCNLGYTPLHFAVKRGNKDVFTLLIRKGAHVNGKQENNMTFLHTAAMYGCVDIAEDLLNRGFLINSLTLIKGYTPLHFACQRNNKETVKLLVDRGADINALSYTYKTPLHIAVEAQHLMVVKEILKYGPDINNQNNKSCLKTAVFSCGKNCKNIVDALLKYGFMVDSEDAKIKELVFTAVEKGFLKIVEDLLKYGADINTLCNLRNKSTLLHCAVQMKQIEVAKLLIDHGADINARDVTGKPPIYYAIEKRDFNTTKLLLTNRANIKDNPLLLNTAVQYQCIEIVQVLLQHGADTNAVDKYKRTALHFTSEHNSIRYVDANYNCRSEITKMLLRKGANVDAQNNYGETTLHTAVENGFVKVVEALLEYNANVNSFTNSCFTPLHISAFKGSKKVTTMLLNKGANINAANEGGLTALHIATEYCHHGIVKILLEYGANVDCKSKNNITPLYFCVGRGNKEIIDTLKNVGFEDGRAKLTFNPEPIDQKIMQTLLDYGADINITTRSNQTPLDFALERRSRSSRHLYSNIFIEALKCHINKIHTANFYVTAKNLQSKCFSFEEFDRPSCELEVASMKLEKIYANISFYDILVKDESELEVYMRNENVVQVLKSGDYQAKFPIYASMIKNNFRKGMERRSLYDQCNKMLHFLFENLPPLPYICTEKIISYIDNQNMKILVRLQLPRNCSSHHSTVENC